jgi:hypothetical protein
MATSSGPIGNWTAGVAAFLTGVAAAFSSFAVIGDMCTPLAAATSATLRNGAGGDPMLGKLIGAPPNNSCMMDSLDVAAAGSVEVDPSPTAPFLLVALGDVTVEDALVVAVELSAEDPVDPDPDPPEDLEDDEEAAEGETRVPLIASCMRAVAAATRSEARCSSKL